MAELMQFILSGVTVGAVYALVALGFTIIYNASDVVNFAQGEFVMLGGMITVFASMAGLPLPLAALIAIAGTAVVGVLLNKLAIEPARGAPVVSLIIITIGASIFIRGVAQLVFDKQLHRFPAFSGDTPIQGSIASRSADTIPSPNLPLSLARNSTPLIVDAQQVGRPCRRCRCCNTSRQTAPTYAERTDCPRLEEPSGGGPARMAPRSRLTARTQSRSPRLQT